MSIIESGGPAFPAQHFDMTEGEHGMTLRDYFAAKSLPGLMARAWQDPITGSVPVDVHLLWALAAYKTADAMLEARK